jgi:hypothetical protein
VYVPCTCSGLKQYHQQYYKTAEAAAGRTAADTAAAGAVSKGASPQKMKAKAAAIRCDHCLTQLMGLGSFLGGNTTCIFTFMTVVALVWQLDVQDYSTQ